jgi:hypothetical protein
MRYQVRSDHLKDQEFAQYEDVLSSLELTRARDEDGQLGVVQDRVVAERILKELQLRLPYLPWVIVELPDQSH